MGGTAFQLASCIAKRRRYVILLHGRVEYDRLVLVRLQPHPHKFILHRQPRSPRVIHRCYGENASLFDGRDINLAIFTQHRVQCDVFGIPVTQGLSGCKLVAECPCWRVNNIGHSCNRRGR